MTRQIIKITKKRQENIVNLKWPKMEMELIIVPLAALLEVKRRNNV